VSSFRRFINSFREPNDAEVKRWHTLSPVFKFMTWPFFMSHKPLPQFTRWLLREPSDNNDSSGAK